MKKIVWIAAVSIFGFFIGHLAMFPHTARQTHLSPLDGGRVIENAFEKRIGNIQVKGRGVVTRLLKDDTEGRRHQKFIVRLNSGHSLLVVHNIDLAPRVRGLRKGDNVEFYGEYEYNDKGGLVHWTHHAPDRRHEDGWIRHNGKTYR